MVHVRRLTGEDTGQAIGLSHAERWNQTLKDWELLTGHMENVCLAAVDGERIIGTATAMVYENRVAWIGMVLVDRACRGRGLSRLLLDTLFEKLEPGLSLKLDATPAGQPVYEKYGFRDEYLVYRMTRPPLSLKSSPFDNDPLPERITPGNLSEAIGFDSKVFGAGRQVLVDYLLDNDPGSAWLIRQEGIVSGLALGRKGARFHQVGPVMASCTEDARRLITWSLKGMEGDPVVMDVLEDKKGLMEWLKTLGFSPQRHFVRMFRYENPYPGKPENHYLIAGPEFG
jgi:GNAT superfamily N-acetyltransferase